MLWLEQILFVVVVERSLGYDLKKAAANNAIKSDSEAGAITLEGSLTLTIWPGDCTTSKFLKRAKVQF
jgi:hypothetical protein